MSAHRSRLGDCPECGGDVLSRHVLIAYESGVWAECPDCWDVVDPR